MVMRGAIALAVLMVAGCGQSPDAIQRESTTATYDVAEPPSGKSGAPANSSGAAPLAVSVPQIAYVFHYSFRLPAHRLAKVQAQHVALCDGMGPARCQVLGMDTRSDEAGVSSATLKLRVASAEARRFGAAMAAEVGKSGGRTLEQTIESEDVSKQMVDAQARIGQRQLLVERLTEILRTRTGKVGELVEAERSVATAQEELDAARGWLAELRGRVALSTVEVTYDATPAAPGLQPFGSLGEDVAGSVATFVGGLRALLSIIIFLAPWALLFGLPAWLLWRRRRRWRRVLPPEDAAA